MAFDFKNSSKGSLKREYDKIAREIGDDQFFTKKELDHLPNVLQDGEQVLAFTSGLMNANTWLITLTDRRVIFLDKGMFIGLKQEIVNLNKINAVSCSTGFIFGKIIITDGAKERIISNVQKKTVVNFTNKVQSAIENFNNFNFQATDNLNDDIYVKLEKLDSLRQKNIISDEEFDQEKRKLLGN
ncbi:MAG: PH domain-containing protein [Candidatus Moranbacteria bacterium]|nr:PH domain-containing protein [Candidatus Moranbacteria bacterium]